MEFVDSSLNRLRLSQAGFMGTKGVVKTGLVFSSPQLCFLWLALFSKELSPCRGKDVQWSSRLPSLPGTLKTETCLLPAFLTKLPGNALLVLV